MDIHKAKATIKSLAHIAVMLVKIAVYRSQSRYYRTVGEFRAFREDCIEIYEDCTDALYAAKLDIAATLLVALLVIGWIACAQIYVDSQTAWHRTTTEYWDMDGIEIEVIKLAR